MHNVFSCNVDRKETSQRFKDYTLREAEIADDMISRLSKQQEDYKAALDRNSELKQKREELEKRETLPKRLRGKVMELVGEMTRLQKQLPYEALLKHYCPSMVRFLFFFAGMLSHFQIAIRSKCPGKAGCVPSSI